MITYAYLGQTALGEVIFEVIQVVHDNLCLPWLGEVIFEVIQVVYDNLCVPWPNSAWRGYI